MPGATFAINQSRSPDPESAGSPGVARRDLWHNRQVRLVCTTSQNSSYSWSLLAAPPGSAAALTGSNTSTATFTPDLPGPYRVQLVTNGGGPGNVARLICAVTLDDTGNTIPGFILYPAFDEEGGEANWDGNERGYATTMEEAVETVKALATSALSGVTDLDTRVNALEVAAGGGAPSIVFKPAGPASSNVFMDEAALIAAIAATKGKIALYFDLAAPYSWNTNADFENRVECTGNGQQLAIRDGKKIRGLSLLRNMNIVCSNTSGSNIGPSLVASGYYLTLDELTTITFDDDASAFSAIDCSADLILKLAGQSQLASAGSPATGGMLKPGADRTVTMYLSEEASISGNTLRGAGTYTLVFGDNSVSASVLDVIPGTLNVRNSFADDYTSNANYSRGVIVYSGGNAYLSKSNNNIGHAPPNATWWAAL